MNILVLGSYSDEATHNDADFARWLEKGGGTVVRFDPGTAYIRGGIDGLERTVRHHIDVHRIEVVMYALGMEFDFRPAFFKTLPEAVLTVLLVGDDEHYFDVSHRYYGQAFDLVLTINPLNDRYRLYGMDALFLPTAFSAETYRPATHRSKTIDVSFVGGMRGKVGRAEYAQALLDARVDFHAYGAGTANGFLTRPAAIDIYRSSRINLNFTGTSITTPLDAHLGINRRTRQIKGRPVQVALCGSFVLSEYAPGIERVFEIGKEIDVFRDKAELLDKVRYYLTHEDEREQMATAAYRRASAHYEEGVVGKGMLDAFAARRAKGQRGNLPLCVDKGFQYGFGAWRWYYIVQFVVRADLWLLARELALLLSVGRCDFHASFWFSVMGLHAASRTSLLAARLAAAGRYVRRALQRME